MMATVVYLLSTITCLACALLLLRSYKRGGSRLLLWSGICFLGLAVNNAFATIDVNTSRELLDLSTARLLVSLGSLSVLIFGLTWEST
ncbi:MAG: DUF5985 family protein [Bdellovibrionota bacterium]